MKDQTETPSNDLLFKVFMTGLTTGGLLTIVIVKVMLEYLGLR
jgi:hypothetical protein